MYTVAVPGPKWKSWLEAYDPVEKGHVTLEVTTDQEDDDINLTVATCTSNCYNPSGQFLYYAVENGARDAVAAILATNLAMPPFDPDEEEEYIWTAINLAGILHSCSPDERSSAYQIAKMLCEAPWDNARPDKVESEAYESLILGEEVAMRARTSSYPPDSLFDQN